MTEPMTDERLAEIKFFRLSDGYYDRTTDELVAEVERCHKILAGLREEYALYRGLTVSADPAERWTGPGANGAAEGAAWKLRATSGTDVTVVRRYATSWSKAAAEESVDV